MCVNNALFGLQPGSEKVRTVRDAADGENRSDVKRDGREGTGFFYE